jgi:eukaryotic-like serine/threonine-protein kinase
MSSTLSFGDYSVVGELGRGGMGLVYLVMRDDTDERFALKVINNGDAEFQRRLQRESEVLANLQHQHMVRVVESGNENGHPYFVMTYYTGGTLADVLERDGSLRSEEVVHVLATMCDALAALHDRGLVHRDVKPSNIMLDGNGEPYLGDLGLATSDDASRLTTTGSLTGTLGYTAPELLDDVNATPASDVYALGVTCFQLLTGSSPFQGKSAARVLQAITKRDFAPLSETAPATPPILADVVTAMMSAEPEQRPSIDDVLASLATLLPGTAVTPVVREVDEGFNEDGTITVKRPGAIAKSPKVLEEQQTSWRSRVRKPKLLIPIAAAVLLIAAIPVVVSKTHHDTTATLASKNAAADGTQTTTVDGQVVTNGTIGTTPEGQPIPAPVSSGGGGGAFTSGGGDSGSPAFGPGSNNAGTNNNSPSGNSSMSPSPTSGGTSNTPSTSSNPAPAAPVQAAAYDDLVLAKKPVGYWRFDERSGTSAADSSGNGNSVTHNSGVTSGASGQVERSVDYRGNGGASIVNRAPVLSSAFSFEAWVSIDSLMNGNAFDLVAERSGWNAVGLMVQPVNGRVTFGASMYNDNNSYFFAPTTYPLGGWYHLVFTYSASDGGKFFVNGTHVYSLKVTGNNTLQTALTFGGTDGPWGPTWMDGRLDEVAIYNSVLSPDDVVAHYRAGVR